MIFSATNFNNQPTYPEDTNDKVSVEDLKSQVDEMKRLYDKLAKDLNHKPIVELESDKEQRYQRTTNEVRDLCALLMWALIRVKIKNVPICS